MSAEATLGHSPFFQALGPPADGLENRYQGQEAILICGGPSFLDVDPLMIRESGLLTMTLNNGIQTFRSDLWLGVDSPGQFDPTIWNDPEITKFLPDYRAREESVYRGVNVFTYRHSLRWCDESVFGAGSADPPFNPHGDGARTSMIDAIRVLFLLGMGVIHLFGVDFFQSRKHGYHHPSPGYQRRVGGNNRLYERMAARLTRMRPFMEQAGLTIYNCNPSSRLNAFEKRRFTAGSP